MTPNTNKNAGSPTGRSENKQIQSAREFTVEAVKPPLKNEQPPGDTPHFNKSSVPVQRSSGHSPKFKLEAAKSSKTSS